ncbi:MAG: hypothetical protein NTW86_24795 [Candidatus Sumerlaeota bacterium]|nr:hypothetical protein [Candidatus Sumerlaeota bacterium]
MLKDPLEQEPIPSDAESPEAKAARTALQKVLDSMYVKPDFYTQGGVTREDNTAPAAKTEAGAKTEQAILDLKQQRKEFEKGSKEWEKLTQEILSLHGRGDESE